MANISTIKVGSTTYGITATPTAHATSATTYGTATASKYGHVKLSDYYTSSAGTANSGVGASSAAVYNAYRTLNSKFVSKTFSASSLTYNFTDDAIGWVGGVANETWFFAVNKTKNVAQLSLLTTSGDSSIWSASITANKLTISMDTTSYGYPHMICIYC